MWLLSFTDPRGPSSSRIDGFTARLLLVAMKGSSGLTFCRGMPDRSRIHSADPERSDRRRLSARRGPLTCHGCASAGGPSMHEGTPLTRYGRCRRRTVELLPGACCLQPHHAALRSRQRIVTSPASVRCSDRLCFGPPLGTRNGSRLHGMARAGAPARGVLVVLGSSLLPGEPCPASGGPLADAARIVFPTQVCVIDTTRRVANTFCLPSSACAETPCFFEIAAGRRAIMAEHCETLRTARDRMLNPRSQCSVRGAISSVSWWVASAAAWCPLPLAAAATAVAQPHPAFLFPPRQPDAARCARCPHRARG